MKRTLTIFIALLAFSIILPVLVYSSYSNLLESSRESLRINPFPGSIEVVAHASPRAQIEGVVIKYNEVEGVALLRTQSGNIVPVILRGCWTEGGRPIAHTFLYLRPGAEIRVFGIEVNVKNKEIFIAKTLFIHNIPLHRVPCPHNWHHHGHCPRC